MADTPGHIHTGRFRRRLTITFILIAGLSAGTVGLGSYILVRDVRTDDFLERSLNDAEANYLAALEQPGPQGTTDMEALVRRLERRAVDATVVTGAGSTYASPGFSQRSIPPELLRSTDPDQGDFSYGDVTLSAATFLVVATPSSPSGMRMFFFYSRGALERGLQDLAGIIWRLWLVVVVGAGLAGNALARRTLRPVSRASDAARSLAEGLLDTRLPIEREDEFGAWAISFNEMAEALQAKIGQLVDARDRERRFSSDVSHELRTPLSALVTSASMLEEKLDQLDGDTRWIAQRTINEARRLRGLVDELLEIARLQSGREAVRFTDIDLGRLVQKIVSNQGWSNSVSCRLEPVNVSTDKARVERIVVNLIANAIEHGRSGARVSTGTDAGTAKITVQDDGPGIASNDLPHIFERFYKCDPSRAGGSGLGLAIAQENAHLLGGTIEVISERGNGATFTLKIPIGSSDGAYAPTRDAAGSRG